MTLYGAVFYLLAFFAVATTFFAIIARHPVRSIIFLIGSFICTALIFYLLGAPFLAAFEVIIYAGAIMVLFLFVIMTIDRAAASELQPVLPWLPYAVVLFILFIVSAYLTHAAPVSCDVLRTAVAGPRQFGQFIFQTYWLPVEIVSVLLLVALVGALYLGRHREKENSVSSVEGT
jgi:NADH-quinone oxidoreductase subunit J